MTAKEYLKQAYRLDHRINSDISELGRLREMSSGISSPGFGEKVQTSHSGDAPFVKCLERIYDLDVIRQIKRCLFRQIKTGLSEHLTME